MCHSPVPCHAHTTQAQDNFPFVYDIFRLLAAAFTETVQIQRRPYILCLSCATLLIAKHTALLSLYPTPPPTTPPPCLTNFFFEISKYRKYPRCIV